MRKKARRNEMISHNINDLDCRGLDLCGEFSEIEVAFMCEFLEPGDVAVEVGAKPITDGAARQCGRRRKDADARAAAGPVSHQRILR